MIRSNGRRLACFGAIGLVCTAVFVVIFSVARANVGPITANAVALSLSMALNFAANRWITFRARRQALRLEAVQYLAVYVLGLTLSSLILKAALAAGDPGRAAETVIAVLSGGASTLVRFILLSAWVFPNRDGVRGAARAASGPLS